MAQYYNLVTNAGGALTFEEVPRICTVDGQRVQLVVENVNNSGNGSQQLVTYTATPQNRQAIFSPQTINLGNQITATRLEQGQNVFIIKTTTDIATTQGILKSNTSNAHVNENIVSIVDNIGAKTECKNEGQQVQWIKMQNANSTTSTKQSTLLQEKNQTAISTRSNIQNNITSPSSINVNSGSFNSGQAEKKLSKPCQNKTRPLTNSVKVGVTSQTPDEVNVITTMENRVQNSNIARSKSGMSVCSKVIGSQEQNITIKPISTSSHVRPVAIVPPEICKTPEISKAPVRSSDIKYLTEQIKYAKLKQLQKQHIEKQRFQQNNAQRQLPNASQQSVQSSLSNTTRRSVTSNSVQQRVQQRVSISPQKQQKSSAVTSRLSSTEHNTHVTSTSTEVNPAECAQEKGNRTQQSPSRLEQNSPNESIVYFQKVIHDPANTKVKHQVKGNTAKMLVITMREQRLIGFDIPNEDCTVQDLLDQVRAVLGEVSISLSSKTVVSLVNDSSLNINYIVDVGTGTLSGSFDNSDHGDCNSQENISSTDNLSQNTNASDENSNTSLSTSEMFYKKNNERNAAKLEKIERDGPTCKRPKGKGRASKPKPIHKEPECLTISSDEEEEGRTKKVACLNNSVAPGNASNALPEDMDTILDKEPVITNTSVFSSYSDFLANIEESSKGICDNQSFLDNEQLQLTQIAIECRTVRIGSYKYYPREKVVITYNGVRFSVPLLEDVTSFVTLDVKYQDIVKLLIHYGKGMPVLFFYTSTKTGAMIRELLGMQDPKGPYYDPAGKDQTHKRITLLPEKLPDDSRATLKLLFARGGKIEELNPKEANDILIRASPRDNQQSQDVVKKQVQGSVIPNSVGVTECIQTITVYPPPPAKGGIAINTEDYLCLAEDQFLNDVIIDFYLKYLTLEVLSESDQQRTHVFSSYFYKRLTSPHAQAAESNVPMTPAAKRHARVQKWTKNVNIFEKDFIIIPINEHAHWFLAIICFPGLVGKISTCVTKTNENDVNKAAQKSKKLKELKAKAVTIGSTTITPVPTTITIDQLDDGSERDEAEGDDEEMEMYSEEEEEEDDQSEEKKNQVEVQVKVEPQKETVKMPCILIFDSLAGASRARVVATLRDYLSCEHLAKLGVEKTFSKDTIKGACPKVPQQSNFTDCGLYVLQYVESFFQDPIIDYTLPIKTLKTWFEEIIVTRKREELSQLLIKLMNSTKGDKTINLPTVNFPTQDGKLKPKSENNTDVKTAKPEAEIKRKASASLETETRIVSIVTENTEQNNEFGNRTYQFIPLSTSSNSTENNSTEMLAEQKPTRSSSETMSYLKAKRIPRLMSRTQNQDDSQSAKRHKGESVDSCK